MRKILLIISFLLFSCAGRGKISVSDSKMILHTTPSVVITSFQDRNVAKAFLKFTDMGLSFWKSLYDLPTNDIILTDFSNRIYRSYMKVAGLCFENSGNIALAFGAVQAEWLKEWQLRRKLFHGIAEKGVSDGYYIISINDFQKLFKKYDITQGDYSLIYKMINRYLLDNILFVSVQELMERPYRYFNENVRTDDFTQMVSFPEMALFYRFVSGRFSHSVVKALIKNDYSPDNWKKHTGEEVHETEGAFKDWIEKKKFNEMFDNKNFTKEFAALLKLYNTGTKSTLFHK